MSVKHAVESLVVTLVVSGLTMSTAAADELFIQKPLFIAGLDGVNIYRIPSLIVSKKGTLLAFCEAREAGDKSPTDLVLKRSFDNGKTWQPMQTVVEARGNDAIMNPTPLVDRRDGTIWMICNLIEKGPGQKLLKEQVLVLGSTDDGALGRRPPTSPPASERSIPDRA